MIKTRKWLGALFFALTFLLGSSVGVAQGRGHLQIMQGGGEIVSALIPETKVHVDAIVSGVIKNPSVMKNVELMTRLRNRTTGMTVARFDYTYMDGGTEKLRIYHARSGWSVKGMIKQSEKNPADSSSTSSKEDALADIENDAMEDALYPVEYRGLSKSAAGRSTHVRARNLPVSQSKLTSRRTAGRDAELKALRQIEADINKGIVRGGGRIRAYVSKMPCESCQTAMREFSSIYDVKGEVYYLDSGNVGMLPRSDFERDSRDYFQNRAKTIRRALQPGRVTAPAEPAWGESTSRMLERAAAEEAGLAAGCE